ncbi:unnamed protein product [Porites lobata]|uniref:Tyr recombinase domain-containing protein n=1 Tax=Porites lobata TaxID=104759 RepID=A0ABN8QDY8_9CNID|nr:unnamed protein product [Porites lobata]
MKPFLKQENLATPTQLRFKELRMMAKTSWFGWPSEAQRPDMVRREDTKECSNVNLTKDFCHQFRRKFLSTVAKNVDLHREGKKVINHSVRKTCISSLLDANVPENLVAQLSGHKSTESLQSYKSTSAKHQKRMSLTLGRADLFGS